METLKEKVSSLPLLPGCYIFKNVKNEIIYIGKSKALRHRVRQYFQNVDAKEGKYIRLSREINDFEYILTDTERDALILECQLIKKYMPKYNTQQKRTINYPYIKISTATTYPTISIESKVEEDGSDYFGYFNNEDKAYQTILLMNSIWQTPICGKAKFSASHKPCLNYHLQKCCAPCSAKIDKNEYQIKIKEIKKCLRGSSGNVIHQLNTQMNQAAKEMDFEKAAYYRNTIQDLENLHRKSKRLNTTFNNTEVFLFFRAYKEQGYSLFYIKDGVVRNRADFSESATIDSGMLASFLEQINSGIHNITHETDGKFMATCLLSIFADKYFVTIPKHIKKETIQNRIEKAFYEFHCR